MNIAGRQIGNGAPTYVVAEMSANHNQQFDHAVEIIHAARQAGADAVKFQTYTPDTLTIQCDTAPFRIGKGTVWEGRTLYDLYAEAYTPWDWQPKLQQIAHDLGLACFSTPFDDSAVDFLETLAMPAYKIASFELVDHALLRRVARTGKPVILSTGMATLDEIAEAVRVLRDAGGTDLALLKCTSAYPALPADMNLRTIPDLAARFAVPVGLSDHTLGLAVPVAAVTLGACLIEKHLTLSRQTPGPDSAFSLEPPEFQAMVQAVRAAEQAVGKVTYEVTAHEAVSRVFRRSLIVVRDVRAGQPFSAQNIRAIRPGQGLPPKYLPQILGRPAARDIARGTPLDWSHISGPPGI